MCAENYNIYNSVSFSLIDKTKSLSIRKFNPEYKYFRSKIYAPYHFNITIYGFNKCTNLTDVVYFEKNKKVKWAFEFFETENNIELKLYVENIGIRNYFKFLTFKNLYVRSLIMYSLLKTNYSLVHSAGFSFNKNGVILAGRPGVFKTSILLDSIRTFGAEFLGEENTFIGNSFVYPFPLNIDSINYKIENFKNENARNSFQKIALGIQILKDSHKENLSFPISEKVPIKSVAYIEKGNNFNIKHVQLSEIIHKLVLNELLEFSIPPTHNLSGINYNYFWERIIEKNLNNNQSIKEKIEKTFIKNFENANCFKIIVPKEYSINITKEIIRSLKI